MQKLILIGVFILCGAGAFARFCDLEGDAMRILVGQDVNSKL